MIWLRHNLLGRSREPFQLGSSLGAGLGARAERKLHAVVLLRAEANWSFDPRSTLYARHMSTPGFERKAKEVLGEDAGLELVAVMDRIDPIRGDIAELKQAILAMDASIAQKLLAMDAKMLAMELRLTEKIGTLDARISDKYSGLLKWSFLFWVGAVTAIAGLAGVLKR
jgi:hypothetical protein